MITDKDGNKLGEGTVGEDGSIKIETNRPLEAGEIITATPSSDGKKGTPTTVTVLPKEASGTGHAGNTNNQDPQMPMTNQPTSRNQAVTGISTVKTNAGTGQSVSSKDLPKTGEEIYQTTSLLGVVLALLSSGIFLIRRKEQ